MVGWQAGGEAMNNPPHYWYCSGCRKYCLVGSICPDCGRNKAEAEADQVDEFRKSELNQMRERESENE